MLNLLNKRFKLNIIIVTTGILIILFYWLFSYYYPSTDDAYTGANQVNVMAQVGGKVDEVFVSPNQEVRAGQLIFTIEQKSYQLALEHAQLELNIIKNEINNIRTQLAAAKFEVMSKEATYNQKNKFKLKSQNLYQKHYVSTATYEEVDAAEKVAYAELEKAKSLEEELNNRLDTYHLKIKLQLNKIEQLALDLKYTKIKAPFDGIITDINLRPGQFVNPGRSLFSIVDYRQFWVDANFKETQMKRIKVGQKVKVTIDMLGSKYIIGKINSISHKSGAALSLLPPENFSGNWVKITQRIPVRITIDNKESYRVPVGASANVSVDTWS